MMLMATPSAAASLWHVSAIRSAVARLMVVKSWICSAALPLTTNCGGTVCASTALPRTSTPAASAPDTTLRKYIESLLIVTSHSDSPARLGQHRKQLRMIVIVQETAASAFANLTSANTAANAAGRERGDEPVLRISAVSALP